MVVWKVSSSGLTADEQARLMFSSTLIYLYEAIFQDN